MESLSYAKWFDPAQAPQAKVGYVSSKWHATEPEIAEARKRFARRIADYRWRPLWNEPDLAKRLTQRVHEWLDALPAQPETGSDFREEWRPAYLRRAHALDVAVAAEDAWVKPLPFYGENAFLISIEHGKAETGEGGMDSSTPRPSILAPSRVVVVEDGAICPPPELATDVEELGRGLAARITIGAAVFRLDGKAQAIHLINQWLNSFNLCLISSETAEEYANFFCCHMCSDASAFTIIERSAQDAEDDEAPMEYGISDFKMTAAQTGEIASQRLELAPILHADFEPRTIEIGHPLILLPSRSTADLTVLIGTVEHSGQIYRCALSVPSNGFVDMEDDVPVHGIVPIRAGMPWFGPDWLADGRYIWTIGRDNA